MAAWKQKQAPLTLDVSAAQDDFILHFPDIYGIGKALNLTDICDEEEKSKHKEGCECTFVCSDEQ